MRLLIDPPQSLPGLGKTLDVVIAVAEAMTPEIHVRAGLPKPDRHMLLGLIQGVALAVSEQDPELVTFVDTNSIQLQNGEDIRGLTPGLVIGRDGDGGFAILAVSDPAQARALTRQALRWFTGTIRLDIP